MHISYLVIKMYKCKPCLLGNIFMLNKSCLIYEVLLKYEVNKVD